MIERTLVLLKPDAVQRCVMGRILSRFEDAGIKVVGMKMKYIDKEFAKKHYTEDVAQRRGERVRNDLIEYVTAGPVVAMVLEGIHVIEIVRKMVGPTEPKSAQPGTIRADFTHQSYAYADAKQMPIKNLIHASGDAKDAEYEVALWFNKDELHTYKTVHDVHILEK